MPADVSSLVDSRVDIALMQTMLDFALVDQHLLTCFSYNTSAAALHPILLVHGVMSGLKISTILVFLYAFGEVLTVPFTCFRCRCSM